MNATVAGRPVLTLTPSFKVNFAVAKWNAGMISTGDLESVIAQALCDGELAPTADPQWIMDWARLQY